MTKGTYLNKDIKACSTTLPWLQRPQQCSLINNTTTSTIYDTHSTLTLGKYIVINEICNRCLCKMTFFLCKRGHNLWKFFKKKKLIFFPYKKKDDQKFLCMCMCERENNKILLVVAGMRGVCTVIKSAKGHRFSKGSHSVLNSAATSAPIIGS